MVLSSSYINSLLKNCEPICCVEYCVLQLIMSQCLPLILLQVAAVVATSLVVVSSQSIAIVEGPQSQTVFLDPSQNVAFSCKYMTSSPSDFSDIEVITNGTVQHNIHQSLERDEKDSSLFVRSLSIARIQKYNVSMIQCRVENEIAKGLLLIQGRILLLYVYIRMGRWNQAMLVFCIQYAYVQWKTSNLCTNGLKLYKSLTIKASIVATL